MGAAHKGRTTIFADGKAGSIVPQYHAYNAGPPPPGAEGPRKATSSTDGWTDHLKDVFRTSTTEKVMDEVLKAGNRLKPRILKWYRTNKTDENKAFLQEFLAWKQGFDSAFMDMIDTARWDYSPNQQAALQYRKDLKGIIERFKGKGGDTRDFARIRQQLKEEKDAERKASQWNWVIKGGLLIGGAWAAADLINSIKAE